MLERELPANPEDDEKVNSLVLEILLIWIDIIMELPKNKKFLRELHERLEK